MMFLLRIDIYYRTHSEMVFLFVRVLVFIGLKWALGIYL